MQTRNSHHMYTDELFWGTDNFREGTAIQKKAQVHRNCKDNGFWSLCREFVLAMFTSFESLQRITVNEILCFK